MKSFSLLIKPASADCNLHCPYCFYLNRPPIYPESKHHRMSEEVLERLISTYMSTEQPQYIFGWQGGEPTLMGIDFFKKVVEMQQKYGKNGALVGNGLQTNAILINDNFSSHFTKYNFLIGVSLDGPEKIHNFYRVTVDQRESHSDVLKGIESLRQNNVEFNILTLVTSANVKRGKEVYNYLGAMGFLYHQYIPCVEFNPESQPESFAVTGKEWGNFLCEIFDEWIKKDMRRVSIRLFDSILTYLVNGQYNICSMGSNCCQYFVVEYNGDIYPCDFFVDKDKILGNIMYNSWSELQESENYLSFGRQKSRYNNQCSECEYLKFCFGDCLKHRFYENGGPKKLSWLCAGWKQFYKHSLPKFKKMALSI